MVSEYVALPTVEPFSAVQLNVDVLQSHVPQTVGVERRPFNEVCAICAFSNWLMHTFYFVLMLTFSFQ